jgi:glycosyltransferase involved in cell wall biosynthesis
MNKTFKVAILIPCFNEEQTITKVVESFNKYLPDGIIYVYDNASVDDTFILAKSSGAIVRSEINRGKGNVIRRMFADIDADIFIMVDGDATYDISVVGTMIDKLIVDNLDMVIGARKHQVEEAYRRGHIFGNWGITYAVSFIFCKGFKDMLSGYRVMSKRFVKSFPITSSGFEIETEMAIHALQLRIPFCEIDTKYDVRPEGSESKLNTWRDGFRILKLIILLFKEQKPFKFFGFFFIVLASFSIVIALPLLYTWLEIGLVPRLPTAMLSTGLMLLAFISLLAGIILDSLSRARLEAKRMHYLNFNSVNSDDD